MMPSSLMTNPWSVDWVNKITFLSKRITVKNISSNSGYGVGDLWVSFDQFTAAVTGNGYPGPSYDQYEAFIDVSEYSLKTFCKN